MAALAAGGHYDPAKTDRHEGPYGNGHLGDLPALYVDKEGKAVIAGIGAAPEGGGFTREVADDPCRRGQLFGPPGKAGRGRRSNRLRRREVKDR